MGWAFVQSKNAGASTVQFTSNTTTGNQVVVLIADTVSPTGVSISPGGGTFTRTKTLTGNSLVAEIWECPNITGGTTPTVTVTGTNFPDISIYEFSGGDTGGATDGTNGATVASSTAASTGQITTTVNGDLVVKVFAYSQSANGVAQSGWTEINPMANGDSGGYIIQGTAGAITGTDTGGATGNITGVIAAFKAASGSTISMLASVTAKAATTPKLGVPLIWDSGREKWDDAVVTWDAGAPMTWDAPSAKWDDPINVWDPGNVEWDSAHYNWDDALLTWNTGFPATWDSRTSQWDDIVLWDAGSLIWDSLQAKWDDPLLAWDAGFVNQYDSGVTFWDDTFTTWQAGPVALGSALVNGTAAIGAKLFADLNITAGLRGTAAVTAKLYANLNAVLSAHGIVTAKLYADIQAVIAGHATVTPKLYADLFTAIAAHAAVTASLVQTNACKAAITAIAAVTPKLYADLFTGITAKATITDNMAVKVAMNAVLSAIATLTAKPTAALKTILSSHASDVANLIQNQPCNANISARAQLIGAIIISGMATRFTSLNNDELMSLYSGLTEFINFISQSQWWNDYATIFALKNELITELRSRNLNVPDVLPHDTQGTNLSMKF